MGLFGNIFGAGTDTEKVKEMIKNGATIIDVRTRSEFTNGHVAGSKNIPLQEVQSRVDEFKKMKNGIVLCCASGNRSGQATDFLKSQGLECVNGGGWKQVNALV
ncbi:MAG: rhodanese-like domain-containing protein [Chitinophagales bacterium]